MDESAPKTESTTSYKLLAGTDFLALEHAGRMALTALLPLLLLAGVQQAFALWTGANGLNTGANIFEAVVAVAASHVVANLAVALATTLLLLSGLHWLLDQRVRHELARRPGYQHRLAYKLPVYAAFAVTAGALIFAVIELVAVVLSSLTLIGVSGADIGGMYLNQFLPTLLGSAVLGLAAWYQYKLLKGVSKSSLFSLSATVLSVVIALTLLITAAVTLHSSSAASPKSAYPTTSLPENSYQW